MFPPITPARRLADAIETRAIEAQLIRRLVDLGENLVGEASAADGERWSRQQEDISAVLRGASAMIGDLVEELGRMEDRARAALQDAPRRAPGTDTPAAA